MGEDCRHLAGFSLQLNEPAPTLPSSRDILKSSSYCSCETSAPWPPMGLLTDELRAHPYLQASQVSPYSFVCIWGGVSTAAHLGVSLRNMSGENWHFTILILRARGLKTGSRSCLYPYKSQKISSSLAFPHQMVDQAGPMSWCEEALLLLRPDELALSHPGTQV